MTQKLTKKYCTVQKSWDTYAGYTLICQKWRSLFKFLVFFPSDVFMESPVGMYLYFINEYL